MRCRNTMQRGYTRESGQLISFNRRSTLLPDVSGMNP